jgi:PTS system ascorbate-specific IIB component
VKIVTLCACGLGTCFALKIKTEEALERLGMLCEVLPCDVSSGFMEQAELYVMPYGLDMEGLTIADSSVLVIEDVLDVDEIEEKLFNWLKNEKWSGNGC